MGLPLQSGPLSGSQSAMDSGRIAIALWILSKASRDAGRSLLLVRGPRLGDLVVVLGFRIEELAGGGKRLGGRVLIFLAGGKFLATIDALGLVGAAGDGHSDLDVDLGMDRDQDGVFADG